MKTIVDIPRGEDHRHAATPDLAGHFILIDAPALPVIPTEIDRLPHGLVHPAFGGLMAPEQRFHFLAQRRVRRALALEISGALFRRKIESGLEQPFDELPPLRIEYVSASTRCLVLAEFRGPEKPNKTEDSPNPTKDSLNAINAI